MTRAAVLLLVRGAACALLGARARGSAASVATRATWRLRAPVATRVLATAPDAPAPPAPPASAPEPLPYAALAEVLARMDEESSRLRIISELSSLFHRVMAGSPHDLVPTLQLATAQLGPSASGIELGMGDIGMISAIAEAAAVEPAEVKLAYERCGDLGLVARELRPPSGGDAAPPGPGGVLTVREVLRIALEIAETGGNGAVERKASLVAGLLRAAPCGSSRLFLVRTLLGRLRVGASEATVLSALGRARLALELGLAPGEHPDALAARAAEQGVRTAFRRLPNLVELCAALLAGPLEDLEQRTAPRHALPVQPMLQTAVASVDEALGRLRGAPASFEFKYDGERVQVHLQRGGAAEGGPAVGAGCAQQDVQVEVFSRSCENVTFKFEAVCEGARGWLSAGTSAAIFEAEAVAVDKGSGRILPFALVTRRPRKPPKGGGAKAAGGVPSGGADGVAQLCLFAFDLLSLDGASALGLPFGERRQLLRSRLLPTDGSLQFAQSLDSGEPAEIAAFMGEALAAGCEGLMIKSLEPGGSAYEPGHRSVRNFKLKRDYLSGQVDTFDLVPVGAYLGKGKRAGQFGAFLLACRSGSETGGGEALQTVCKLGSGFSEQDTAQITAAFKEQGLCEATPPPELELGKIPPGRQPDVWLRPSAVWEVLAAEISPSPTYSAASGPAGKRGLALRFPRFVRARDDKRVRDATLASQIASAYAQQLASSGAPADEARADVADAASPAEEPTRL